MIPRRIRPALDQLLEGPELIPATEEELLLRRTFTASGTNRQFVNGSPTTLNVLAGIGELLVDIHGPHEHQSLLHTATQLAILDAFGKLDAAASQPSRNSSGNAPSSSPRRAELVIDEKTYAQQLDLLRFQATEIEGARLQPGEEDIAQRRLPAIQQCGPASAVGPDGAGPAQRKAKTP